VNSSWLKKRIKKYGHITKLVPQALSDLKKNVRDAKDHFLLNIRIVLPVENVAIQNITQVKRNSAIRIA
jgi:hypothetical protein